MRPHVLLIAVLLGMGALVVVKGIEFKAVLELDNQEWQAGREAARARSNRAFDDAIQRIVEEFARAQVARIVEEHKRLHPEHQR